MSFALDPVDEAFVQELPELVARDLEAGRLRSLWRRTPEGLEGVADPAELPPEALYGLFSCVRPWTRGGELDLLVDAGHGPRPVTVWITRERDAEVAWGDGPVARARPPTGVDLRPWTERVAERNGLSAIRDGLARWAEDEVSDVAAALALLTEDERAFLDGVELVRDSVSPRAPKTELAWFDPSVEPPRITFFDLAFRSDAVSFVGPAWDPRPSGAMTALHEFAHVLADAPLRRAYRAYLALWSTGLDDERARALYRDYRALGRGGPVLEAWREVRGGRPGPSAYGLRSVPESFAEAFALHHLDPDALERVLPGAGAWFAAGGHVEAAGPAAAE